MTDHPPRPEHAPLPAPPTGELSGYPLELARTTCLLVLTVLACAAALSWLRPVVVPFLVALALFYLLSPVREWLVRRFGASEMLGVLGAALCGSGVVAVVGALVWGCAVEVTRDSDVYAARLAELAADPTVTRLVEWAGIERDPGTGRIVLFTPDRSRRLVKAGVGWLEGLLVDTFLVLTFLLFMLMGGPGPRTGASRGLPAEAATRVRKYLIEMFVFSVVTGVLVGGILGVLGVKFWLSFGFLAFVLNFIPTIGPILATLLPLPAVFLDPELSATVKVLAVLLPGAVQVVIGNFIQPRFQSRTQGVHPVTTMLALIVFGMLWGPVGAVLAIPLTAILKIAFERIPGGQPFADLLAGRRSEPAGPAAGPVAPPRPTSESRAPEPAVPA
jgi:AI-2 transport protein TqsA